ncbi:hypothetical protein PM082_013609 [Marasmius tenuissimus]|nr:hypothetical protein PM082_013609 [Marasmius tenuissimus]
MPTPYPILESLQDPHPYLKVISAGLDLDSSSSISRPKVPHLSSDAPLLDLVASFIVARHDQSAVVFASTLAGNSKTETNLYILFNDTPPPTIQSHLRSLFTLLRTTPRPDLEQDKTIASISSLVYLYSWERWTFYLRKVLDSLQVIEEKAGELGLQQILDASRHTLPEIRALGEVLAMNRKEGITFAASTTAQLSSKWKKDGLMLMRLSPVDKEPVGLFPRLEIRLQKIPLYLWITQILSVHENSSSLVRLVSSRSFGIVQGSVNIVVLAPSKPAMRSS